MALAAWRTTFLAPAHGHCVQARNLLGAVLHDLRSPQLLHDRDAAGRYILLDSATNNAERAWRCLSTSMDGMLSAELVALRSCGRAPAEPVASVDLIRDGADADADALHNVWLALVRLQGARGYGQEALGRTEAVYGHLHAAQFMMASLPPPAGPDAAMDQVRAAVDQIRDIEGSMKNMIMVASLALEPPLRIQWR